MIGQIYTMLCGWTPQTSILTRIQLEHVRCPLQDNRQSPLTMALFVPEPGICRVVDDRKSKARHYFCRGLGNSDPNWLVQ